MNKPTYLRVFDFDGTLIFTPGPTSTIDNMSIFEYYDKWLTENNLPKRTFNGHWGRIETLTPPIFGEWNGNQIVPPPNLLNKELCDLVLKYQDQEDSLSVIMTGRHVGMRNPKNKKEHICRSILDIYGLKFDRYIYKKGNKPTSEFKIDVIFDILAEFPSIKNLEIWDDREEHIMEFRKFINYAVRQKLLDHGVVNQVFPKEIMQ